LYPLDRMEKKELALSLDERGQLRSAPDGYLTKSGQFAENQEASVASLRRWSPSAGIVFGFLRNAVQLGRNPQEHVDHSFLSAIAG
jgi:hypothetical protein